jgi:hypothetical protein
MTVENTGITATDEAVTKALESIDGLWTVVRTSGEAYDDHSYDSTVGLFPTEAAADAYIAVYAEASEKARRDEYNTGSWSMWRKKFVPTAPVQIPNLVLMYEVETSRSWEENGKREVERVQVWFKDLNKEPQEEMERLARENPEKAFQATNKYGEPNAFAESAEFPELTLSEDGKDYDGQWETFYSFSKDAVVLDPPAGYVHPEPIPWEPAPVKERVYAEGEEVLAEWERELLGLPEPEEATEGIDTK